MVHGLGSLLIREVDQRAAAIEQAIEDVDEAMAWERIAPGSNPLGNLVLHLCGNLRQYVVKGVGGQTWVRDRPREFQATGLTRKELLAAFRETIAEVRRVLSGATDKTLSEPHEMVEFAGLPKAALALHAVEHLGYHTGQIVLLVKVLRAARGRGAERAPEDR